MAEPTKIGSEFVVNAEEFAQTFPSPTYLAGGGYVVVWVDPTDGDGAGIGVQIFDSAGNKVGGPFLANTQTVSNQVDPHAVTLANGNFVVVWRGPGAPDPDANGIRAQIFDPAGNRVGSEILVNTIVAGDQTDAHVTPLASGGFLVSWSRGKAQIFDSAGNRIGGEFAAAPFTADVAGLTNGGFVAAWSEIRDGSYFVFARRYDAFGNQVGGEVAVAQITGNFADALDVKVEALTNGGYAVAWVQRIPSGETAQQDIRARVYGPNGLPVGEPFTVNSFTAGNQIQPELAALSNGAFIVTWTDTQGADGSRFGIMAQAFDSSGARIGSEFVVNTDTAGIQQNPDVTQLSTGQVLIVWQDQVGTSTDFDIKAQIVSVPVPGGGMASVRGSEGDDSFTGTAAAEHFVLLGGNDRVTYTAASHLAGDVVDGGPGTDTIVLRGEMSGGVVFGPAALQSVEAIAVESGRSGGNYFSYNITSRGGNISAGQRLTVDASALQYGESLMFDAINENAGSVAVTGGASSDYIFGSNGDDYVRGGGGADSLVGHAGNDTFFYGSPAEVAGDAIRGGAGEDRIVLRGHFSGGVVFAGAIGGVETILLTSARDTSFGPAGDYFAYNVTLAGGNVAAGTTLVVDASGLIVGEFLYLDAINENAGALRVVGGASRDYVSGSNGDDVIQGAAGGDYLRGNGGADRFVYNSASESTSLGFDQLVGFDPAADRIDVPESIGPWTGIRNGTLNAATFDADLAGHLNDVLEPYTKALFNATSGDFAGRTFVVADANGDGSYTGGVDYVFEMVAPAAPLHPASFFI